MTDYTQPITLIRLSHPARLSVVEFAYTPRYSRWTAIKYNVGEGQTASDAWINGGQNNLAHPDRIDAVSHGNTDLAYADLRKVVGHLCLAGWVIRENSPYSGPSGFYECNAANTAELEEVVLF